MAEKEDIKKESEEAEKLDLDTLDKVGGASIKNVRKESTVAISDDMKSRF